MPILAGSRCNLVSRLSQHVVHFHHGFILCVFISQVEIMSEGGVVR